MLTKFVWTIAAVALWAVGVLGCGVRQPEVPLLKHLGGDFLNVGHRGAPQLACENTLPSFALALDMGANALELDLSMTRDEHLVLWHDWINASLESSIRPTGRCSLRRPLLGQPVHTMALAEFMRDYGYEREQEREPVTLFKDFVRTFAPDKRVRFFFLDLKVPENLPELVVPVFQHAVRTLRQYGALSKTVFLTPYEPVFYRLHTEMHRWQKNTGMHVEVTFDTEGPQIAQWGEWPSTVRRNQIVNARFATWGMPLVAWQDVSDFIKEELQRRDQVNARRHNRAKLGLIIWTVNDPAALCALVALGVNGIMTDEPDRLATIRRHWGQPGVCQPS